MLGRDEINNIKAKLAVSSFGNSIKKAVKASDEDIKSFKSFSAGNTADDDEKTFSLARRIIPTTNTFFA